MSAGRRATRALALAALASATLASPMGAQQQPKPRLEPVRVSGEIVLGAYAGIGGFVVGRAVAHRVADLAGIDAETARRKVGIVGGVIGGTAATAGMVYAIGGIANQAGDFDDTMVGTAVGFVAAVGIARIVLGPEGFPREGMSSAKRWAIINAIALLPSIGATIGFNSTRRIQ